MPPGAALLRAGQIQVRALPTADEKDCKTAPDDTPGAATSLGRNPSHPIRVAAVRCIHFPVLLSRCWVRKDTEVQGFETCIIAERLNLDDIKKCAGVCFLVWGNAGRTAGIAGISGGWAAGSAADCRSQSTNEKRQTGGLRHTWS
jgi:hypothetical protein